MKLFLALSTIFLVGCYVSPAPTATYTRPEQRDDQAIIDWNLTYTAHANAATERMYQCITEMYATLKGGGPVCRDACDKYATMIKDEQDHPAYFARLGVKPTTMPDRDICRKKK